LIDIVPHGGAVDSRPSRARASKVDESAFSEEQADPQALARFEKLRAARSELARARDLPAYCICHDSTLRLIARFAPNNLQALEQIKGIGPYKVQLYGEKFLHALKNEGDGP
jgi:ATP-dependent DNA helicase RecQ